MPLFEDVCATDEIPPNELRAFEVNGVFVAVAHLPGPDGEAEGGTFTAMEDSCPHAGAPLSDGHLEPGGCGADGEPDAGGATVVCPLHAWRFDCRTGHWCDAPKGKVRVETYETKVENGRVLVCVPD
ncbi:Rieske (2Fe-2S) protein [Alienimonas chondri]|uniref:Naphthalene 1,2-dioxygenase/salicylate 5-hydroxylase systems, ferredoxin component n=1 Tax=Alienimonas chondri TaxID=2681879 RepID=A0ABX1VJ16_9PLAN|nr:Rieske (2Fe-2S) protein [Alienimonas chondri]NNJ28124.1 Naphthalene 1,2-dioxygenase/salicylate 5-hydroxylase systems, ferredoxin component [Alienimonas chondri]